MPDSHPPRVVMFGTYDESAHPRVAVLAEGLASHGIEIVTCNVQLGLGTAARLAILRQPWRLPAFAARLLKAWVALAIRSRRITAPDAVVVGYMGHFDIHLARRLFPRARLVLDHLIGASDTAQDRGERTGLKTRLLERLDVSAVSTADIVVLDTPEHLRLLPGPYQARSVVVPVGAPAAWFRTARSAQPLPRLQVVFFGLYTPLQGTVTIGEAAAMLEDAPIDVTMIGHGQDREAAVRAAGRAASVRWIDWVPSDELPQVVANHDVCLGIFGSTPKALRVVPNKVFQGAAAGCAIVTSDTAPQREALGADAVFVPPADAPALASALRELAARRRLAHDLGMAARRRACERFSAERVVQPLIARLYQGPQPMSP